jgi:transcriptional regulator with XRE-family HTH domain
MPTVERIFLLMKKNNLNQKEMADRTGVPQSSFTDWKKKRANPSAKAIEKIANSFGLPIDYFYDKEEETCKINAKSRLKDDEKELLEAYNLLTLEEQEFVLKQIKALAEAQRQITSTCEKGENVV